MEIRSQSDFTKRLIVTPTQYPRPSNLSAVQIHERAAATLNQLARALHCGLSQASCFSCKQASSNAPAVPRKTVQGLAKPTPPADYVKCGCWQTTPFLFEPFRRIYSVFQTLGPNSAPQARRIAVAFRARQRESMVLAFFARAWLRNLLFTDVCYL